LCLLLSLSLLVVCCCVLFDQIGEDRRITAEGVHPGVCGSTYLPSLFLSATPTQHSHG